MTIIQHITGVSEMRLLSTPHCGRRSRNTTWCDRDAQICAQRFSSNDCIVLLHISFSAIELVQHVSLFGANGVMVYAAAIRFAGTYQERSDQSGAGSLVIYTSPRRSHPDTD